jgi:hypothetical protein
MRLLDILQFPLLAPIADAGLVLVPVWNDEVVHRLYILIILQ